MSSRDSVHADGPRRAASRSGPPAAPPARPAPSRATAAPEQPWYAGGLRFTCTQCGNCCSGAPGYVWATAAEIRGIARRLGLSVEQFMKRHVRRVGGRYSLKERRGGDCEFLHRLADGRAICSIYEDRPQQCRTWPFWKENVSSPEAWAEASLGCPGMNNGTHHPLPVIQQTLASR